MKLADIKALIENGFPIGEKPGRVPFTHTTTVSLDDIRTRKRFEECFTFFEEFDMPILDVGGENVMGEAIKQRYVGQGRTGFKIDNTRESDFNETVLAPGNKYKTILCFEVIEHVMNPLHFIQEIYKLLDANGVLYISTPKAPFINILSSTYHFTEYKQSKMEQLFKWAGFRVEKSKVFNVHPWWSALTGVRPLWKYIFQWYVIYKLTRPGTP